MDYYLIAEIEQPAGRKGFIRINPLSDFPKHLLKLKEVYIDFWGLKKLFQVEEVKEFKKKFLLKFLNFDSLRDCRVLSGRKMYIDGKDLIKLPEKHFFIHDLIGLKVFGKQEILGVVKDVLKLPANDVMVIETKDGSEMMIPFVLQFIEKIEPEKREISLKVGKDFFETEK